jgi:hypothetical protein
MSIEDEKKVTNDVADAETIGGSATDGMPKPKEIIDVGTSILEKEHTIFVRILNFEQLKNANHAEIQEQWGVYIPKTDKNAASGKIRVRRIEQRNGEEVFEITTKIPNPKGGSFECSAPTNKTNFTQIKMLSDSGMLKHRYVFNIKDSVLKWELDVFPDGKGGYLPWGKMDLEVNDLNAPLPKLPIDVEETILPKQFEKQYTPEEREKKIKEIDKMQLLPNAYLKRAPQQSLVSDQDDDNETDDLPKKDTNTSTPEEKLSADDITDDPNEAENVVEKAEEIQKDKNNEEEDVDDDLEETTKDNNEEEESETGEKVEKALNAAKEAFNELIELKNHVISLENYNLLNELYVKQTLANVNKKVGLTQLNSSLENYNVDYATKEVALEGIIKTITEVSKTFIKWFTFLIKNVQDYYRKTKINISNLEKRISASNKQLSNPTITLAVDANVKYDLSPFSLDGKYTSVADAVVGQSIFLFEYYESEARKQLSKIINIKNSNEYGDFPVHKFIDKLSELKKQNWFLLPHSKNIEANIECLGKFIYGKQMWVITKPILLSSEVKKVKLSFEIEKISPFDFTPDYVTVEDKDVYHDVLNKIVNYLSDVRILNNNLMTEFDFLQKFIKNALENIDNETFVSSAGFKFSPYDFIDICEWILNFMHNEKKATIDSWLQLCNHSVDYINKMMSVK